MTLRFGVLDLPPHPFKDQWFGVFYRTLPAALRTTMQRLLGHLFRTRRQDGTGQLPGQFIPNLDRQSLQINKGPRSLKFFLLSLRQLGRHPPNPPSQLIIHDQTPVNLPSW